jgi:Mn-dependent DtxR family transcriptional regulator
MKTFKKIKLMMISAMVFEKIGWSDYETLHTKIFGMIIDYQQKTKSLKFNMSNICNELKNSKDKFTSVISKFANKNLIKKSGDETYELTDETLKIIKESSEKYKTFEYSI